MNDTPDFDEEKPVKPVLMDDIERAKWRAVMETDFHALRKDVHALKEAMGENTMVTKEIHELVSALKFISKLAKWVTPILGAATALLVFVYQWKEHQK